MSQLDAIFDFANIIILDLTDHQKSGAFSLNSLLEKESLSSLIKDSKKHLETLLGEQAVAEFAKYDSFKEDE